MSYLSFLTWLIANAGKIQVVIAKLQEIAALFSPAPGSDAAGTLQMTADPSVVDGEVSNVTFTPTAEEEDLESQALALVYPDSADGSLAVRDGTKLRKLFQALKPIIENLPAIISLLGAAK